MFNHLICPDCKSELALFTDETILRHAEEAQKKFGRSYKDELTDRLIEGEKKYIKQKIKLHYLLDRYHELTQ